MLCSEMLELFSCVNALQYDMTLFFCNNNNCILLVHQNSMPRDKFPSYVRELIEHLECQNDGNASLKAVAQFLFSVTDRFTRACRGVWVENSSVEGLYSFLLELPIDIILSVG